MDNKKYYEGFDWTSANLSEKISDKITSLLKIMPHDVSTIADIGCGDGSITNVLSKNFHVYAIDRSLNALKFVITDKLQASADFISLKSRSVDLVFSSEMIEHLPDDVYSKAISEFGRIARNYIMLTFPDDENISKNFVECINCKTVFNKSYHLRTLNKKNIIKEFPDFEIIDTFKTGSLIRPYKKFLSKIKHNFCPSDSWIPLHWTPDGRRSTMCPNCDTCFEIPYKFNLLAFLCDSTNTLISPKRPYQICILLKRKND
jgi:ubiquinone/menaquinone biosynthesis C-methylase UbiE